MHYSVICRTYFEANFENKQKLEEKGRKYYFFALFFYSLPNSALSNLVPAGIFLPAKVFSNARLKFCGKIYLKNLCFVCEMSAFQTFFARHNVFTPKFCPPRLLGPNSCPI
jgi:hypothetical protein